jgi:hypothetical protein
LFGSPLDIILVAFVYGSCIRFRKQIVLEHPSIAGVGAVEKVNQVSGDGDEAEPKVEGDVADHHEPHPPPEAAVNLGSCPDQGKGHENLDNVANPANDG